MARQDRGEKLEASTPMQRHKRVLARPGRGVRAFMPLLLLDLWATGAMAASLDFIDRAQKANKPFFVWFNASRMHIWTHRKQESEGKTSLGIYPDGMVEHDGHVGQLLKKLDDLGIAQNTIVRLPPLQTVCRRKLVKSGRFVV
jgi:hypothetical protein